MQCIPTLPKANSDRVPSQWANYFLSYARVLAAPCAVAGLAGAAGVVVDELEPPFDMLRASCLTATGGTLTVVQQHSHESRAVSSP